LKALDFGVTGGEKFAGLKIPTFEEILEKFASRCVMNIHVKLWDTECDERALDDVVELMYRWYDGGESSVVNTSIWHEL